MTLKLPCDFVTCLKLNPNLIVTEKVIEEIMLQLNAMINHHDMFLSFIRNVIFLQQHFKRVLIDFLLKPASQLFVKLNRKSEKGAAFLWI